MLKKSQNSFRRNLSYCLAASLLSLPAVLFAQSADDELPKPPTENIVLPDSKSAGADIVIGAQNAFQYRSIIIPELYGAVRTGNVQLAATRSLGFDPVAAPELKSSSSPDAVLQRTANLLSGLKFLSTTFDFVSIKDNQVYRSTGGELVRLYPHEISSDDRTGQIFRERIRFVSPAPVVDFTWFTFRFGGSDEDVLWVYSPVLSKSRQLAGSNRSDGLLRSSVSPDDLFTWSGKFELVSASEQSETEALVPFPSRSLSSFREADGCAQVEEENSEDISHDFSGGWNFARRRFPDGAPWLPADAVYVPRKLLRLELEQRDPYSLYGRQVLYLDKVTGLPIYKFVFDRTGRPWKTIITGWGFAQSAIDSKENRPYPEFTIVDDALNEESFVIDFSKTTICSAVPKDVTSAFFDPRRFGVSLAATPVPTVEPR